MSQSRNLRGEIDRPPNEEPVLGNISKTRCVYDREDRIILYNTNDQVCKLNRKVLSLQSIASILVGLRCGVSLVTPASSLSSNNDLT